MSLAGLSLQPYNSVKSLNKVTTPKYHSSEYNVLISQQIINKYYILVIREEFVFGRIDYKSSADIFLLSLLYVHSFYKRSL